MQAYKMKLTGLAPLLMHFDNIAAQDAENARGKSGGKAGDDRYPMDRWKGYLYVDDTAVVMPSANVLAALLKVGSQIKIGGKLTMKGASQGVMFDDIYLRFLQNGAQITRKTIEDIDGETFDLQRSQAVAAGFEIAIHPVRVNGNRHIRTRPMFSKWSVEGRFQVDDPDLTAERLNKLFELAGVKAGLGDWRPGSPSKPGPYGRFSSAITPDDGKTKKR